MPYSESEIKPGLQRKPLKKDIFEVLHKRIIAGKYSPGEWLRQEEISTQLGVSQTPVREALDLLVSAGLAERVPYRGVRVLQLSTEEIIDAYELRLLLDSTAARSAAERGDTHQTRALSRLLEKMKPLVSLNDMSRQRQLNREFHRLIAETGRNDLLIRIYEMASNAFPDWMLYEAMFHHPEMLPVCLEQEYQEHAAILEAISTRDAPGAAKKALEHILTVGKELEILLGIPADLLHEKERQFTLSPQTQG